MCVGADEILTAFLEPEFALSPGNDQLNAVLLNEFFKEHKAFVEEQRKVDNQEARIKEQGGDNRTPAKPN
jgi:hypothetical protein